MLATKNDKCICKLFNIPLMKYVNDNSIARKSYYKNQKPKFHIVCLNKSLYFLKMGPSPIRQRMLIWAIYSTWQNCDNEVLVQFFV